MAFMTVPALVASAAERHGGAIALVAGTKSEPSSNTSSQTFSETFLELHERVAATAGALLRRDVRPGDRILIVAPNSAAAIHAWLGAIHAGAVPAAVNPELTVPELQYLCVDLRPALVVSDGDWDRARDLGAPAVQLRELEAELGDGVAPHAADPGQPAAMVYTSGTTSRPKGVLVRHAAYTETGLSFPRWVGLGPAERLWACLPLFHINAQAYSLMSTLAHGYSLAVSSKFHASTFWRDARELEVTSVNLIGAMVAILERQPPQTWVESALRTVYAAPAPATPDQRRRLEERFRVRITGGYGMSENTFGCAESPTSRAKAASIGRPRQPSTGAFNNELRILAPDGREVAPGEVGELCFRNPVMTPGYWNAPEVTEKAIVGGWLHTGDAGHSDADGDVFLAGRYKEMIRRRGENIAPGEVEDALVGHPAVSAAAVFGVPSELSEDEVVAAVVLAEGGVADETGLREWAARSLAAYKVPSRVLVVRALPMTPTQRVAKDVLRRDYLEGRLG